MDLLMRASFCGLVLIGLAPCASAQDGKGNSANSITVKSPRPVLTGKERLGPKWTDEQRIDNCHVPLDKRGNKLRPDDCPNTPSS